MIILTLTLGMKKKIRTYNYIIFFMLIQIFV